MTRRCAAAVALAVVLTGCSDGGGAPAVHDPSVAAPPPYAEAVARARAVARETVTEVIGGGATLRDLGFGDNPTTVPCTDASDPPPDTPVDVAWSYEVVGADPTRVDHYFTAFREHWTGRGWTVQHGSRADDALAVGRDGFVVLLQLAPSDDLLSITTHTPCLDPPG